MSAAAVTVQPSPKAPKRAPDLTEAERKECVVLPKGGGYGPIPNDYFDELPRKCAGVEYQVVGVILRNTWGGDFGVRDAIGHKRARAPKGKAESAAHGSKDKTARPRPAWTPLTAPQISKLLVVSAEAVEDALRQAELHGYVESRICGRVKWYRACPENFAKGEDREERTVERKPAASEPEIRTVAPHEKLILLPGAKARPFRLSDDLEARFHNRSSVPLAVLPPQAGDGYFDFIIEGYDEGYEGETKAKHTRTPVRLFGGKSDLKNGEDRANDSRTPDRVSKNSVVENTRLDSELDAQEGRLRSGGNFNDLALMCDFLNRWCSKDLGKVSEQVALQVIEALGGAPIGEFAARLKKRVPELEFLTWKLVVDLASDVGRGWMKRQARLGRSPESVANLTPGEISELERHYAGRRRDS